MLLNIVVALIGATGLAWVWQHRREQRRTVVTVVAVAGLGFQVVHALEHLVQIGAWGLAPGRTPYLTPWAAAGRHALAVDGNLAIGEELLHLSGNLVFLAGLVALVALAARTDAARSRNLRLAVTIQGVHVLEHAVLTATAAAAGRAVGVTTLFGTLEPGPLLFTVRPLAHFTLNAVATAFAVLAALDVARSHGVGTWMQPAPSARP
jgi:hypothetical protein